MNFAEDEPRKVPQPIPFCQNSPLHPAVPEVSLILQEAEKSQTPPVKPSFLGTEFQTYNAWRWKNINEKEKCNLNSQKNNVKDFYPINDKYFDSEIERRKNEILYGSPDNPRKPLPPRPAEVIPSCIGASFSDASCNLEEWPNGNNTKSNHVKTTPHKRVTSCHKYDTRESNFDAVDLKSLYHIISEQNVQMLSLQKQIEQLLKSQESKEKQVEQLLKTQGVKETKIEQLLEMQDLKERRIEQLLKVQEKNERQINLLIQSQDERERQNYELLQQLKSLKKEKVSIGVEAKMETAEKGCNTVNECESDIKHVCRFTEDDDTSNVPVNLGVCNGRKNKSFTLNSVNFPLPHENIPTPQSSIHVDIPEYNGSSDEEGDTSTVVSKVNPDPKSLGYTFYNKVLTQVNDIIKDNKVNGGNDNVEKTAGELDKAYLQKYSCLRENNICMLDPSRISKNNVEKFLGVHLYEDDNIYCNRRLDRLTEEVMQPHVDNASRMEYQSPSDVSLKMNALALKYLKREQISQYEVQPQCQPGGRQPDVTIYNVTNLSLGTMRYLERYHISSQGGQQINTSNPLKTIHSPQKFLQQKTKESINNAIDRCWQPDQQ